MAEKKNEEVVELVVQEEGAIEQSVGGFANEIMTKVATEGFFASFDTSTDEGKIDVYNAINDADVLTAGEVVEVQNLVIAPAQVRDAETGELKTLPAVTLITPNGEMLRSTSSGVVKSSLNILSTFGADGKLSRVIKVAMKELQLPGGRQYKKLTIVK